MTDNLIDLAPGDYIPPYDWKHGYIPISPAAALSKAKGSLSRAEKLAGRHGLSKRELRGLADEVRKAGGIKRVFGSKTRRAKVEKAARAKARTAKALDDAARGRAVPGEVKAAKQAEKRVSGHYSPEVSSGAREATLRARESGSIEDHRAAVAAHKRARIAAEKDGKPNLVAAHDAGIKRHEKATEEIKSRAASRQDVSVKGRGAPADALSAIEARTDGAPNGDGTRTVTGEINGRKVAVHTSPSGNKVYQVFDDTPGVTQTFATRDGALARINSKADAPPVVTSSHDRVVKNSRLQVGDRVETEFGSGKVVDSTDRTVGIGLDNGDTIRVSRGTPGYDRIKKADAPASDRMLGLASDSPAALADDRRPMEVLRDAQSALAAHGADLPEETRTRMRKSLNDISHAVTVREKVPDLIKRVDDLEGSLAGLRPDDAPEVRATVASFRQAFVRAGEVRAARKAALTKPLPDAPAARVSTNPAATIRVEHSLDGTLVHGTTRGDTDTVAALKENGFKWSRNLDAWYLPRTWGESTRERRVRSLTAKLGDRVGVDYPDNGPGVSARERLDAEKARAAARAAHFDAKATKLDDQANAAFTRSDDLTKGIPFGQPILVGHHSEQRHRRTIDKAHKAAGKGLEASRAADRARETADNARRRAQGSDSVDRATNRVQRLEANARDLTRRLDGNPRRGTGPATGDYRDRLLRLQVENDRRLEVARERLKDTGGPKFSKSNVAAGDFVKVRGVWYPVTRTNDNTVSLPRAVGMAPGPRRTVTHKWTTVDAHKSADAMTVEELIAARDAIPASFGPHGVRARLQEEIDKRAGKPNLPKGEAPVAAPTLPKIDGTKVAAGDVVKVAGKWYPVTSRGKKAVTVPHPGMSHADKVHGRQYMLDRIQDHVSAADLSPSDLADIIRETDSPGVKAQLARLTPGRLDPPDRLASSALEREVANRMHAGEFDSPRMMDLAAEMDRRDGGVQVTLPDTVDPDADRLAAMYAVYGMTVPKVPGETLAGYVDRVNTHMATAAKRRRTARGDAGREMRDAWDTYVHTQWLAAEEATRGNLTKREYRTDPRVRERGLLDGSYTPAQVRKYASDELLEWLASSGHIRSYAEFKASAGGDSKTDQAARERRRSRTLSEWG